MKLRSESKIALHALKLAKNWISAPDLAEVIGCNGQNARLRMKYLTHLGLALEKECESGQSRRKLYKITWLGLSQFDEVPQKQKRINAPNSVFQLAQFL